MTREIVESTNGRGNLVSGDQILLEGVEYQFTAWQEYRTGARGEQLPGVKIAVGQLIGPGFMELEGIYFQYNKSLEFVLDDGRRWACTLESPNTGILKDRSGKGPVPAGI